MRPEQGTGGASIAGETIQIASTDGSFDCYFALPNGGAPAPAIIMAPSVFGVNQDLKGICDFFAGKGFVAAAPDIFWRGDKGALPRDEDGQRRAMARVADRKTLYATALRDFAATLQVIRSHKSCNGRSAIFGFCFGGPFAVLGITALGCDAGASFHGSNFDDQLDTLPLVKRPLQMHWGDDDFALSKDLLERVEKACNPPCEIFIYPKVKHGYTGATSQAYNAAAASRSWERSLAMLDTLR